MTTEKNLDNVEYLKTHDLYVPPKGDLIPVVNNKFTPNDVYTCGMPLFR